MLALNRSSLDGDVSNYESKYLAAAIDYPYEKDLYDALKEARLMTEDLKIYGWDEMSGHKGEQNRLRQQKHRQKESPRTNDLYLMMLLKGMNEFVDFFGKPKGFINTQKKNLMYQACSKVI